MGIYDTLSQLDADQAPQPTKPPTAVEPQSPQATTTTPKNTRTPRRHDVVGDVVTSVLAGVDLAAWREVVSDTETHSSALRLSAAERDAVEDLVRDLRRAKRIKTSMNELARLGLLLLVHDFRTREEESIVYRVKKS